MRVIKNFAKKVRKNKILLLMLLPAVVYVIIFSYIPMGGIIVAFKRFSFTKGFLGSPWCGLENFRFLFISDKLWPLMRNTLLYNIAFITVGIILEVGFAIIVNELGSKWFKKVFQSFMFLPFFISWVVVIAIVDAIFGYDSGIINNLLQSLGMERFNIYVNAAPWPFLLVFFKAWKQTGYGSIVYLAAISGIDMDQYEAADIDGATRAQKLFRITLPNIMPTIIVMFIMTTGQIMSLGFDQIFNMSNAAVKEAAEVLDMYIYRITFQSAADFSFSTAVALFRSVLNMLFLVLADRGSKMMGGNGLFG